MQQVFKAIGNFILNWLAVILLVVVHPLNFLTELIKIANPSKKSFNNALEIDKFGNVLYQTFWDATFRTRGGYAFGKEGETISVAMAKNMKMGTLSWFGWIIAFFMNVVDITTWGKGGHFKGIADKPRLEK